MLQGQGQSIDGACIRYEVARVDNEIDAILVQQFEIEDGQI